MLWHTVLLGDALYAQVRKWNDAVAQLRLSHAVSALISEGLAMPVSIKCALPRETMRPGPSTRPPTRPRMGGLVTVALSDGVVAQIEAHRVCYGLRTMAEAVRELAWLGLGMVAPKEVERRSDAIRRLARHGFPNGGIAAKVGVSRQRVSKVLKEDAR